MKRTYSLMIAVCVATASFAQLNYTAFNAQNFKGTYTDLGTSGSSISTANKDNANSTPQNIGFNFVFNGTTFTQFVLNTNGFIKLGNTPPSIDSLFFSPPDGYVDGVFNSNNAADVNILAAFNHDLIGTSPNSEFRVSTTGSSPNRICTVQFKKLKDKKSPPYTQLDSIDFQIKLYESTNIIDFVYGTWTPNGDSSRFRSAACGLKGNVGASTNQLLTVTKGSTQSFDLASFIDGNYTGNAFNYGNSNPGNGTGVGGSRPMMDNGRTLRFIPVFPNDAGVDLVIAHGELPTPYAFPTNYRARVSNVGINNMTNVYVRMRVTGANTYDDSVLVASLLAGGASSLVTFSGYIPQNKGLDNIRITLRNDDYNANNELNYRQEVGSTKISHVDTSRSAYGIVGWTATGGRILHKYAINQSRKVTRVSIFVSNEPANIGNTVYGVLVDQNGAELARSDNYVLQPSDLNSWKEFILNREPNNPTNIIDYPTVPSGNFFIGVGVPVGGVRFNPVGHIAENPVRPNSFFYINAFNPVAPTDYADPANILPFRSLIKGVLVGNSLSIESVSLKNPECAGNNKQIDVVIKNRDSLAIDFSVDTLYMSISSTGAITQSFNSIISTGTLNPNATQTFTITSSFDLSTSGTYNVKVKALTKLELDTVNNIKSIPVQVISTPGVDLTVSPDSVLCFGVNYTFRAVPFTAGSKLYQWKINGANSGSPTTDSTFAPTLNYGDKVSVDLITDHCTTVPFTIPSNEIMMKINPQPKLISGLAADTVRENTSKSYAIGLTTGNTYLWRAIGGTMPDSTSTAVTVSWGSANPNARLECHERDVRNCVRIHELPVNITSIIGIGENARPSLGQAYPNPANESVIIPVYYNGDQSVTLTLFDITGKQVKEIYRGTTSGSQLIEVSVKDLHDGLYFYRLQAADGFQLVKKLTVRHD